MSAIPRPASPPGRVAGLYAVTPDLDDTVLLVALVDAALRGGAALVQYRNKSAGPALRHEQAARLAASCAAHDRPFIVNDHPGLALSIAGAGLHVGGEDVADPDALRALRRSLGPDRLLGVSCYRSVERAHDAAAAGADYVAFGSVFPSNTKPSAPGASLDLFREARGVGVPLVGIGGITRANAGALVAVGCDAVAVIADLFATRDAAAVEVGARALAAAFTQTTGAVPT